MIIDDIKSLIDNNFKNSINLKLTKNGEVDIEICKSVFLDFCKEIKDNDKFLFKALVDISGVDYLDYGKNYWETVDSTFNGFSRAHKTDLNYSLYMKNRFCVSYHLLSYVHNFRIRLKVLVCLNDMTVPSVVSLWSTANWHEREIYDLFGVIFDNHPNLIRILTDYGFEGHPLRKDFPLTGEYEIRYDENKEKIVREVSSIRRLINTPKIIRKDFRYK